MAGTATTSATGTCTRELASLLSRLKAAGVTNVVWFTADVHYCAAHFYDPARAAFTDFDPFWEFVGGPINAGSFGPNTLEGTFGPQLKFSAYTGVLEVSLRDIKGNVLYTKALEPR